MTRTQFLNLLYALVCALATLGAETDTFSSFLPASAKHYVSTAAAVALYLKSHWNLFLNPDGTRAEAPWEKNK